ncbi:uncharacterized protein IL334_006813 [Kwoniella shivajii]|uniref:Uncharacterized protein n=1 Tax=Kwoniella shivajii TaxID=564305 RepID=A0ABZ1DAW9_9TREE|nr:hypothetical protein IL334_006813 [Kwoniella shivajii]
MSKTPSSATRIVQSLLSAHPHLSTQQIYQTATDHLRPVLRPAHVLDQQGRIRMKKVSNMREGRRPWIPMPTPPFPEHPFKSVNFLKRTILASLESQGLIHKSRVQKPIETDEERHAAIATAMRLTRKNERTAIRLKEPVPPPRIPKTTVTEFAWKMGPLPPRLDENGKIIMAGTGKREQIEEEEIYDEDGERSEKADRELAFRMHTAWQTNRGSPLPPSSSSSSSQDARQQPEQRQSENMSSQEMEIRWDQAARLEESFQRAQEIEAQQIEERQNARRDAYRAAREQKKKERLEDELAGRTDAIKAEKKRIQALEAIQAYANQTGEDVSGWYQELGISEGESIPISEEPRRKRGGSGFGLRKD